MAGKFRKIATEEAFSIPEIAQELKKVARAPNDMIDMPLLKGIYDGDPGYGRMQFLDGLIDLEERRLKDMDENGVDMQLLLAHGAGRAAVRCRHGDRAGHSGQRPRSPR